MTCILTREWDVLSPQHPLLCEMKKLSQDLLHSAHGVYSYLADNEVTVNCSQCSLLGLKRALKSLHRLRRCGEVSAVVLGCRTHPHPSAQTRCSSRGHADPHCREVSAPDCHVSWQLPCSRAWEAELLLPQQRDGHSRFTAASGPSFILMDAA